MDYFFLIFTLLIIVFGAIYLYKRKSKTGYQDVATLKKEVKLSNDEVFNINRTQDEALLNQLLDKINKKGYENLSLKEKQDLKRLSQK